MDVGQPLIHSVQSTTQPHRQSTMPHYLHLEYLKNQNVIRKATWCVHRSMGGDITEMLADANLLFMKAAATYDSTRGRAFSSHVYQVVYHDLLSARRLAINRPKHMAFEEDFDTPVEERTVDLDDMKSKLTDDGLMLFELALDAPDEIERYSGTHVPRKSELKRYAKRHWGWSDNQYLQAFSEIATVLRSPDV